MECAQCIGALLLMIGCVKMEVGIYVLGALEAVVGRGIEKIPRAHTACSNAGSYGFIFPCRNFEAHRHNIPLLHRGH